MSVLLPLFLRLTVGVILALVMASCAIAPAKIKRVGLAALQLPRAATSLATLLERALEEPGSPPADEALAHFVEQWKSQRKGVESGDITMARPDGGTGTYHVRFSSGEHASYPLTYFDEISPAIDYRVQKIDHHRREGIGAPLVALRENRGRSAIEAFYPPEAITRPLTAVLYPGQNPAGEPQIDIQLLCPLRNDEIAMDGRTRPLAADFTVPWASLLARTGKLNRLQITDVLRKEPKRDPQLYLMEPYEPNKKPLIMVHGLLDTTLAWAKLSNELWADQDIRRRYQIWHYLYNTSAPALYSGRQLQHQLRELRKLVDPSGRDPAMESTTVIAHSMGGIVSRRLVTRPGDVFWDAAFNQSFESLKLDEKDRASLKDAFFWEPERHVNRIIYIAVPHRGSEYADSFVGRLGRWLVKPPSQFAAFYDRISSANPSAFTAAYAELGSGRLDSVHALSPKQPTLRILSGLPNSHPVKVHSIIGDRGKPGALKESSDGIVPYWSSHLPDVDSEKIVSSGHAAIDHPESVAEIKRILKLR